MSLYVAGLDLGQARDYTALAILEVTPTTYPRLVEDLDPDFHLRRERTVPIEAPPVGFALRHLERPALGTPYPQIVTTVHERLSKIPGCLLAVDATGVGRAVVDLFRAIRVPLVAITITGGNQASGEGTDWAVPKRDLVHGLLVALQQQRFTAAAGLALAPAMLQELTLFHLKVNQAGHDSYEAWRESAHDDLVLAVALAVWFAEREIEARAQQTEAEIAALEARRFQVRIGPQF